MHAGLFDMPTQRQLVDSMDADKSAVVRALDALEARGLVRREPHPTDRRAHAIVITEAGQTLLGRVAEAVRRTEEQLTTGSRPRNWSCCTR
ncbi:MarR family winged helix-turn-helix transcriptional regulator [Streptacidiphilus anmyonensis]|uniref:MarR family winged helix-turn-helix transcriptional regulator n=1 Tax=Streptacidiphilus anmyonensis TaxID=405782 RepID=UPI000693FA12|nr:MarR family transcriptional regulator [Streptacidiphilus anmyonensis]